MILDKIMEENVAEPMQVSATGESIKDINSLIESFIYDYMKSQPKEVIESFIASEECEALQEAGVLGKHTVVRLNKADDLGRRIKLAVLQKAKEDNDPNYIMYKKVVAKKKALASKLMAKYQTRVRNDAIKSQRALLQISPSYFTRPVR